MFLNAILHSEILLKFHQKCGFFKYLTFNLVCLSQKWCNLTKIHYIGTYMMCSKEKATFGPIFDQVLQALINTLGPQCRHQFRFYSNYLQILLEKQESIRETTSTVIRNIRKIYAKDNVTKCCPPKILGY